MCANRRFGVGRWVWSCGQPTVAVYLAVSLALCAAAATAAVCKQSLVVEVYDPSGNAVEGSSIVVRNDLRSGPGLELSHGVKVDLECGIYELMVNGDKRGGLGQYMSKFFLKDPMLQRIGLRYNSEASPLIGHRPSYSVVGRVLDLEGRSENLVVRLVTLADSSGGDMPEARVVEGQFELRGVLPGMYGAILLDGFQILDATTVAVTSGSEPAQVSFGVGL